MSDGMVRRRFLGSAGALTAGLAGSALWALSPDGTPAPEPDRDAQGLSAAAALEALLEGNRRFLREQFRRPHQTHPWLVRLARNQHPFAVVLGCADSRVPPELVFDCGLGDLFTIREAGHVADDATLGSIEYAVGHLHVPLVVVLGHTGCGAVTAAVEASRPGSHVEGHVARLVEDIRPAVAATQGQQGDPVDLAVRANVRLVADQLRTSKPLLAPWVAEGRVRIVGALYHLSTGQVEVF